VCTPSHQDTSLTGGGAGEGTTKRLLGLVPELVSLCAASTPRSEGKGSADPWAKWRPCGDDELGNQVYNCRTKFISTFRNQQVFKYKTNTRDYSCDLSRCTNYVYLYSLRTRIFIKNIRIRSTIVSTSKNVHDSQSKSRPSAQGPLFGAVKRHSFVRPGQV